MKKSFESNLKSPVRIDTDFFTQAEQKFMQRVRGGVEGTSAGSYNEEKTL